MYTYNHKNVYIVVVTILNIDSGNLQLYNFALDLDILLFVLVKTI